MSIPLSERTRFAMRGAAIGDALGWPQEPRGGLVGGASARAERPREPVFSDWRRKSGTRFLRYEETVIAGEYSDDTQLLLAVARSCLRGRSWRDHLVHIELPAWPIYQRGGGRAVLQAANAWAARTPPWEARRSGKSDAIGAYFDAGANGAAMRITPHAIWVAAHAREGDLVPRIVQDAVTTHGHPRAILGAIVLGVAVHAAFVAKEPIHPLTLLDVARDAIIPYSSVQAWLGWNDAEPADYADVWGRTQGEMAQLLDIAASSVHRGSMSHVSDTMAALGANGTLAGSGTNSVAAALYLASRAGSRPLSGLLQAAYEPGIDTDTVASMSASLLGAVHGRGWLADFAVQDAAYIDRLSDALLLDVRAEPIEAGRPISARAFTRGLDDGRTTGPFPDGRDYRTVTTETLSEQPWVIRHRLLLSDGQTVTVDRVHREVPRPEHKVAPTRATASRTSGAPTLSVSLPTRDLRATVAFYETLLGQPLAPSEGRLEINDQIAFVEVGPTAGAWTADAQITLHDVDLVRARRGFPSLKVRGDGTVSMQDPDGRMVFLQPR
ncbi:MAG: hypothetical protein CVT61_01935 [Actinobacteria bacterium HGW-Actinobacteria-11]|nr:MAG: hypothetical protein CVT61_01935 [Actinobacteria bacterium HGW-Actinobacteria-11]